MIRVVCGAVVLAAVFACTERGVESDNPSTVLVESDSGEAFQSALSPDGARMAWARPVQGRAAIFVANADGGNPVQLTSGVWDRNPVWSPDGQWIAYHGEAPNHDVFVVPSGGGDSRQLTSGGANDVPVGWLADGSGVIFYRFGVGQAQTLVAPMDGSAIHPIVPPAGGNQYVAISPDGSRAAFDLHRGGEGTIWVQDLAGGAARQLTTEGLENALTSAMWSPDSRSVLYLSRRTGTWDIWIADVETGELRQLTTDVRNDNAPRWSPDGRWVLFSSDRGGQRDLWIMPAAGGKARRVTNDLSDEQLAQWTSDGQGIVYAQTDLASEIAALPVSGGAGRTIARFDGYAMDDVTLSPDGKTVLFTSNRSSNPDIWSVPFDGGQPTPLAASPLNEGGPQFSPDGSQVVFVSNRAGSPDLWLMPAAGGEARRLTDWPSAELEPQWSPDGSSIAFISDRDAGQNEAWVIPAAGGEARRLTTNDADAANLQWAKDGRALYYEGTAPGGGEDIYRIAFTGGAPRSLGRAGDGSSVANVRISPDGGYLAYATFLGGWGFIDVLPTAGGAARRLTTDSETVFQNDLRWSPDGKRLAVSAYDYAHDTYEMSLVTWPEGEWSQLTETPELAEFPAAWTPDGRQLVINRGTLKSRIVRVSVAKLVKQNPAGAK